MEDKKGKNTCITIKRNIYDRFLSVKKSMSPRQDSAFVSTSEALARLIEVYEKNN